MATQLSVDMSSGGRKAQGFCTPKVDKTPQVMHVLPKRVIPILFLPGIMGSNLRMNAERQQRLKKSNNIAWRPDKLNEVTEFLEASPVRRQLQLDPQATEVDSYDGGMAPTGNGHENAGQRQDHSKVRVALRFEIDSPLLSDDPPCITPRRTKEEKARERGWGEILFNSYRHILERCEQHLNRPDLDSYWKKIIGQNPAGWGAAVNPAIPPLTEEEFRVATKDCLFPVHAMGYNWLQSNEDSARIVSRRIRTSYSTIEEGALLVRRSSSSATPWAVYSPAH
ncbi:hypothetical protein [Pseudoduganella sp. R-34]|uniref:hypothetical protein n=1 Tax=unclassified Pseudoduganella TaxID=2637179 RepID=UPI003CEA42BA